MSDTDLLDPLRVYTNRGTVAYPLDRSQSVDGTTNSLRVGEDASSDHCNDDSEYQIGDHVDRGLSERLGTVLFSVDSHSGWVRSYFRADVGRPVQLTAEFHGRTVEEAIDRLPDAVNAYVQEVRDGSVACRSLDELGPNSDARAFAALLTDRPEVDFPHRDAVASALRSGDRIDIVAPSVEAAVDVAQTAATATDFPDVEAVVTKTVRTSALADADIVIAVDDSVETVTIRGCRRLLERTAVRRATAPVAVALGVVRPNIGDQLDEPTALAAVAQTVETALPTNALTAIPTRAYRLDLLTAAFVGVLAGAFLPGTVVSNADPLVDRLPLGRVMSAVTVPTWFTGSPEIIGITAGPIMALALGLAFLHHRTRTGDDAVDQATPDGQTVSDSVDDVLELTPDTIIPPQVGPTGHRQRGVLGRARRAVQMRIDRRLVRVTVAALGVLAVVILALYPRLM